MRSRNSAEGSSSNWMKRRRELTEVGQQQSRRDQSGARCDRRASVESPSVTRTAGAIDSGSRRARSARRRCSRKMTSVFAGTHIQPRGSTPWVPPTHTTHEAAQPRSKPCWRECTAHREGDVLSKKKQEVRSACDGIGRAAPCTHSRARAPPATCYSRPRRATLPTGPKSKSCAVHGETFCGTGCAN